MGQRTPGGHGAKPPKLVGAAATVAEDGVGETLVVRLCAEVPVARQRPIKMLVRDMLAMVVVLRTLSSVEGLSRGCSCWVDCC